MKNSFGRLVVAVFSVVIALMASGAVDREFLKALVSIPSETRNAAECAHAVDAYAGWLEARGVFCTTMTNGVGRKFLYAATTPGLEHDFVFVSHLDVVPALDPAQFTPRVEGDILHGRGACDTKGNTVVIAQVLAELAGKASVGVVMSTDEEGGGI